MVKKFFRWITYGLAVMVFLLVLVFAVAYWKKDEILEKVNVFLSEQINGEVHVGKVDFTIFHDFPEFSVTLHHVYLRGPNYAAYKHDFFTAEKIFLNISLLKLMRNEVSVNSFTLQKASIFIFQARDGYTNLDVFKKTSSDSLTSETQSEPFLMKIKKAEFKDVSFTYADSIKNKSIKFQFLKTQHRITGSDSSFDIHVSGQMHFDGLLLKAENGPFLKDHFATVDLHAFHERVTKTLSINPSTLVFDKSTIGIVGKFDLNPQGDFRLKFESDNLDVPEGKTLLDRHLNHSLRKIKVGKPVKIAVNLLGKSVPGNKPEVDVQFSSEKAKTTFGPIHFSELTFDGSFTNHVAKNKSNNDDNSKVDISSFDGMMDEFPTKGRVTVTQLSDPFVDMKVTTSVKLRDLNSHMDSTRFKFRKGTVTTVIEYAGKLAEYIDPTRTQYKGKLSGRSIVKDGFFQYSPRKLKLEKINASIEFNKERLLLNNLTCEVNGSAVKLKGAMYNFVPFFIQPKDKGYIKLDVTSPDFDLTPFAAKKIETERKKSSRELTQQRKKVSDMMDSVFEKLEFRLNVNVAKLTFKQFKAADFSGQLALSHHTLEAKPVTMAVAGGTMSLDFKLSNLSKPINPMTVTAKVDHADIKDFFVSFNNFNQNTIRDHNLSGTISTQAKFSAKLDDNLNVLASSMVGNIDCRIRDGKLINFEPLQNMSNFLFKKRDFTDVDFAELNSHFYLQGTDIDISRMEVQSSVLSLFLHGRYSFTDSTSLSIQLPLSNLKKRNKDYQPQNVGVDARLGPSVFLHVYKDKEGKIAIAYDPFKKWAKGK